MKRLFVSLLILACSMTATAGPRVVGNGGDLYALEFLGIAQQITQSLEMLQNQKRLVGLMKRAVDQTTVETVDRPLVLNGAVKDAINYPSLLRIVVNRTAWAARASLKEKATLVLHEYFGIIGIPDEGFKTSARLVEQTGFGNVAYDGRVYDRKLTKQEIARLVPTYYDFVAARANEIVTPHDMENLRQLKMSLDLDPSYILGTTPQGQRSVIGLKAPSRADLIRALRSALSEMESTPINQRLENVRGVLEGFKLPVATVSCELGYNNTNPENFKRIVRCIDDRSTPDNPNTEEAEETSDIREFILSIDSETLEPRGFLYIEQFFAG